MFTTLLYIAAAANFLCLNYGVGLLCLNAAIALEILDEAMEDDTDQYEFAELAARETMK